MDKSTPDVAYVASLSIARNFRGRGYGRLLLDVCGAIARTEWGYSEASRQSLEVHRAAMQHQRIRPPFPTQQIFLHAATKDEFLLGWYRQLGYEQLPEFDQPNWVLSLSGREATRFHKLPLSSNSSS